MKLIGALIITVLPIAAQDINLSNLDRFAPKASEVVDITLDSSMLQLAARFLSDKDPDEAKVKKVVKGLKGVYVKSFQFDSRGEYQESDVEELRSRFRSPGWSRVVGVRSRKGGDNAEIFLKSDGGQIVGLVIIAADPRDLTVVNIVGPINPDDVRELGGHFGIPKIDLLSTGSKSSGAKED